MCTNTNACWRLLSNQSDDRINEDDEDASGSAVGWNSFFICYLTPPQPTFGRYWGDGLTHLMLVIVFYLYFIHGLLRTLSQGLVPKPGWTPSRVWAQNLPIHSQCLIPLRLSSLIMKLTLWHWFKAGQLGSFSLLLSHLWCDFSFSFSWCSCKLKL